MYTTKDFELLRSDIARIAEEMSQRHISALQVTKTHNKGLVRAQARVVSLQKRLERLMESVVTELSHDVPHPRDNWCTALTIQGGRCLQNAESDGLCTHHWRMAAKACNACDEFFHPDDLEFSDESESDLICTECAVSAVTRSCAVCGELFHQDDLEFLDGAEDEMTCAKCTEDGDVLPF